MAPGGTGRRRAARGLRVKSIVYGVTLLLMLVSSRATRSRLHLLANDCAWRCGAAPGGTGRRRGLRVKIIVYGVILLLKLATTILYT